VCSRRRDRPAKPDGAGTFAVTREARVTRWPALASSYSEHLGAVARTILRGLRRPGLAAASAAA